MKLIQKHKDMIEKVMCKLLDDVRVITSTKEQKEYCKLIKKEIRYWMNANF